MLLPTYKIAPLLNLYFTPINERKQLFYKSNIKKMLVLLEIISSRNRERLSEKIYNFFLFRYGIIVCDFGSAFEMDCKHKDNNFNVCAYKFL